MRKIRRWQNLFLSWNRFFFNAKNINLWRSKIEAQQKHFRPEHRPRIFNPFFTTKKTPGDKGGPIIYGLVKGNEGVMTMRSKPGEGGTFRIFIPAGTGRDKPEGHDKSRIGGKTGPILFVDGEYSLTEIFNIQWTDVGPAFRSITIRFGFVMKPVEIRHRAATLRLTLDND